MELIDTHCHLNDERLYAQADEIVARAIAAGVSKMHVVGYDEQSSRVAIELADRFNEVFAIVGIHPTEVSENIDARLRVIEDMAKHPKVVAIGETGLDFYWHKEDWQHELQTRYFIAQIDIANRRGLPIVVHSRDAIGATLELLRHHVPKYQGVMHCYSGSAELVPDFIKLGLYISLAGPVTFVNAKVPKQVAVVVPGDKLLIETDSPYLAPHPHRGRQNEPSMLPLVAKAIAEIKNVTFESVCESTTANAIKLFHVKHI